MSSARWLRSIRVRAAGLAIVLVVLPILIFTILERADSDRRGLILAAVRDTGDAIAAALAPGLRELRPADIGQLDTALARFGVPDRSIKILLRPAAAGSDFFFVASQPALSPDQAQAERRQLLDLGILPDLASDCAARLLRQSGASTIDDGAQALVSVTAVQGTAGCWAVVIATSQRRILGAIEARPFWMREEVRLALAIYALMATLIAAIFAGVWAGLLRFRRLALMPQRDFSFADATDIPELAQLARAFDEMVHRLQAGAHMLRTAAEENAHALKGPIGTIRQLLALPELAPPGLAPPQAQALRGITTALDRLDGLVRSARHLDEAAADMLAPRLAPLDLSALVGGFIDTDRAMHPPPGTPIDAAIEPGVWVRAQDEMVETILETVMDNARGFSPADGRIEIRLARTGDVAELTISDEGPGVAQARLERIFERYHSLRPEGGGSNHFGIGLWLARQHARACGGDITATNRAPRGLALRITLPMAQAHATSR